MTEIVAGTVSGLTKTVSVLVKELLESQWPVTAFDPLASDIGFGLDVWDNYGDVDIHVTADRVTSETATIGAKYSRVAEAVYITLYVRKNAQEIPPNMGAAQRMIEQIVKDNATALGQGIPVLQWNGWDKITISQNLLDVWQVVGRATAIYFLAKV